MNVLGISCYYHDAAAALVCDGVLRAAAQEERFTRRKHDPGFPMHAVAYCLREAGLRIADIDYIGFYDRPLLKFERLLSTYVGTYPKGLASFLVAIPVWLREKLWIPQEIRERLKYEGEVLFADHHLSHAASAFLVSPFDSAAIITTDGVGEWDTTTIGRGTKSTIELLQTIEFPHSLGLLYSAFTYYLGFKVNSAEYKVMGLAPYGSPRYAGRILEELIDLRDDGSFRLNLKYFGYPHALRMTNTRFDDLWGVPRRNEDEPLTDFHRDMAASIQEVTNQCMVRMAVHAKQRTGESNLCIAGGVGLNCVSNARIQKESGFDRLFIQPAAGDAGGALGVAFHISNSILGMDRAWTMDHAYWGPSFSDEDIGQYLSDRNIPFEVQEESDLLRTTSEALAAQEVVGWFQGRMEWGPRALGNRSILADPRNKDNWQRVNLKIKFRESFRPFAPSVPIDDAHRFFSDAGASPYMLITTTVKSDAEAIPAVTHVDSSARHQTVAPHENPLYYGLLKEFGRQTGVPVLINTSFNVRGEPIVCTPHDALMCFLHTDMDRLVLGRQVVRKANLADVDLSWVPKSSFEKD